MYKWTDADGVVHYSDQPAPGAEKVLVSPESLNRASSTAVPAAKPAAAQKKQKPGLKYLSFSIAAPTAEQTFFDSPVTVILILDPPLDQSHTLTWYLNGEPLADQQNSTQFQLENLARGVYTLSAAIVDSNTNEQANSPSVTFYMRQPSILSPKHK